MTTNLSKKRPKTLAKMLKLSEDHATNRINAIFSCALHEHEKLSDIIERLGEYSCEVLSFRVAQAAVDEIRQEARRRYGPSAVTFESGWTAFLECVTV